jgi:hypothetical protein
MDYTQIVVIGNVVGLDIVKTLMIKEMKDKLKKLLDEMSQEQFDKEWSEIEGLGLGSPTLDEVLIKHDIIKSTDKKKFIEVLLRQEYDNI